MKKILIFSKVALIDPSVVAEVLSKEEDVSECIVCMCIDEREIEYAQKKIVNMGWVGEKIGSELTSSIVRTFRQEAYARADEIEKQLRGKNLKVRFIIETGVEEEILQKVYLKEKPEKTFWIKQRESWLKRLLKREREQTMPFPVEIIYVE